MKHMLTASDILPPSEYEKIRDERRRAIIAMKKSRRISIGPYATFFFENYDTMWLQVQEMLRIEKGGVEQLTDELRAYNPLIPKGNELIATIMFEIEDPVRRADVLARIGGVEKQIEIRVGGEAIRAQAETDLDYTSAEGKASSVQFVHFAMTKAQIIKFCQPNTEVVIAITHPNYGHMAVVPEAVKEQLVKDFS